MRFLIDHGYKLNGDALSEQQKQTLEKLSCFDWNNGLRERTLGVLGRVDIFFEALGETTLDGLLLVENKLPWGSESGSQLKSYGKWLSKKQGEKLILFLGSAEASSVKEDDKNYGSFIRLSYKNLIQWLEQEAALEPKDSEVPIYLYLKLGCVQSKY